MSGVLIPFLMPVYPGAFPTFTKESIDQVGNPALSRQHRHAYAADFHRGLLTGTINRLRS
jgi:hypothetical protein